MLRDEVLVNAFGGQPEVEFSDDQIAEWFAVTAVSDMLRYGRVLDIGVGLGAGWRPWYCLTQRPANAAGRST